MKAPSPQPLKMIFSKRIYLSIFIQIIFFLLIILLASKYLTQEKENKFVKDIFVSDSYVMQQLENYKILGNEYAFNLELKNIMDSKKLSKILFSKNFPRKKCVFYKKTQYSMCRENKNLYIGVTPIETGGGVLGYLISYKQYDQVTKPIVYIMFSIVSIVLLALLLNFSFLFFSIKRKIEKNMVSLLESVLQKRKSHKDIDIIEYKDIADAFKKERIFTIKLEKEKSYNEAFSNLAAQVAHDIRSPLAALNIAIKHIGSLPEQQRSLIANVASRINDIAHNMIQDYKITQTQKKIDLYLVSPSIESIVSEKRLQFEENTININLNIEPSCRFIFCEFDPIELKRIFSNVIVNSVESILGAGEIVIEARRKSEVIEISIKDSGKGIPKNLIHKVKTKGVTTKKKGLGLGLSHADTMIRKWKGNLKVSSSLNNGTTIKISLPIKASPSWFVSDVYISNKCEVVIIEDDLSMHNAWREKLSSLSKYISCQYFQSPTPFIEWYYKQKNKNIFIFSDYELIGESITGLDLLEKFKIECNAILVTSHYENQEIRDRCSKLGIKLMPKNLVLFSNIVVRQ